MGITNHSIGIMSRYIDTNRPKTVFELGSQYLYDTAQHCLLATQRKPVYGKSWFEARGIKHTSIDLNDEADIKADILNNDHNLTYDWVTDFGTIEHTSNAYVAFRNVHNWTNDNGLMIHVNPEVGSWPGHGFWWFTENFYHTLAKVCGYRLLWVERAAAMGNTIDGWDVYGVLQKVRGCEFSISEDEFNSYLSSS